MEGTHGCATRTSFAPSRTEDGHRSDEPACLDGFFRANVLTDGDYHAAVSELAKRKAELATLTSQIATTMVMREMAQPRRSYRLDRGQYNSPAEAVPAATPAAPAG